MPLSSIAVGPVAKQWEEHAEEATQSSQETERKRRDWGSHYPLQGMPPITFHWALPYKSPIVHNGTIEQRCQPFKIWVWGIVKI